MSTRSKLISIFEFLPGLKEEVLKYEFGTPIREFTISITTSSKQQFQTIRSKNDPLTRTSNINRPFNSYEVGSPNTNQNAELTIKVATPKYPLQSKKTLGEINFGSMAKRMKRKLSPMASESKLATEENIHVEMKLEASLMNADFTNPHLFFMKIDDPSNEEIIEEQEIPVMTKWQNLIFDNEHQDIAKQDQLNNNGCLFGKNLVNSSKVGNETKPTQSKVKQTIKSMISISRKFSIFKETLFNTKVQVRLSYFTFLITFLIAALFILIAVMTVNSFILTTQRLQRFDVIDTEIVVFENAWKIVSVATFIEQNKSSFSTGTTSQQTVDLFITVS
jgi:hypothetical protein